MATAVKEVKLGPPVRVKATDLGWDGIALKLRAKDEEFDIPESLFTEDWMERLSAGNGEETETVQLPKESAKRGPGRPPKEVI